LPRSYSPNFVSPTLQKAPQRQAFAKFVAAITCFVVLAALSISFFAHYQARQQQATIKAMNEQMSKLEARRAVLTERNVKLAREDQIAGLIVDGRPAPVPVWFLGYLSEAVPPELVVTNLYIKFEEGLWKMQLSGTLQGVPRRQKPGTLSNALVQLKSRLSKGPFHLTIVSSGAPGNTAASRAKPAGADSISDWITGVTAGPNASGPVETQFFIEGVMR
jgi:hypothetical protein